jgi:hypothetical protein
MTHNHIRAGAVALFPRGAGLSVHGAWLRLAMTHTETIACADCGTRLTVVGVIHEAGGRALAACDVECPFCKRRVAVHLVRDLDEGTIQVVGFERPEWCGRLR